MNFDRLRFVAERAALGEGREALLSVDIPERPGRYATRNATPRAHRLPTPAPSLSKLLCAAQRHTPALRHRVHVQVQLPRSRTRFPLVPARVVRACGGGRARAGRATARRDGRVRHQRRRAGQKPRALHDRWGVRCAKRAHLQIRCVYVLDPIILSPTSSSPPVTHTFLVSAPATWHNLVRFHDRN